MRVSVAFFVRDVAAMPRSVFVDEAAELLGVSRRTVYYRIREGLLQTVPTKGGTRRVLLDSIEALLREGHTKRRGRRPSARTPPAAAADATGPGADV